eukprot:SAG11_NODE_1468_length_4850_cov_3.315513_2_plen_70_part_00
MIQFVFTFDNPIHGGSCITDGKGAKLGSYIIYLQSDPFNLRCAVIRPRPPQHAAAGRTPPHPTDFYDTA